MTGFTHLVSRSVVLAQTNIDTDQIIPARFLSTTERAGLGKHAFNDWRWQADGSPNPAFPFNQPGNAGRQILLAGESAGGGLIYCLCLRLKQLGMREIFVRFPVHDADQPADPDQPRRRGRSAREASVICVREFFPDTLNAAVRQKSRWITGIVIQGFRTLRWTKSAPLNYFLWRDRKGAITNFASFLATLLALTVAGLLLVKPWVRPDAGMDELLQPDVLSLMTMGEL